jgi:hypothetical protein
MNAVDHEVLDLGKAEVLQRRVSPIDAAQILGNSALGLDAAPPAPLPAAPPPPMDPTLQVPTPPTSDAYPARVNDRINKLYGQKREAEEKAQQYEAILAEQNRKLDMLMGMQQRQPNPWTNQYGQSEHQPSSGFIPAQSNPPPAGTPVSREEIQALLGAERQAFAQSMQLQHAHSASRDDAARDFPEVFSDQNLRQAAERIWASDPYLQKDPQGPYKAAALARGLSVNEQRAAIAQAVATDVRKTALTAMGPSVPDGTGQGPSQQQRYEQALARAKYTQEMSDFVLARKIQLGLA